MPHQGAASESLLKPTLSAEEYKQRRGLTHHLQPLNHVPSHAHWQLVARGVLNKVTEKHDALALPEEVQEPPTKVKSKIFFGQSCNRNKKWLVRKYILKIINV